MSSAQRSKVARLVLPRESDKWDTEEISDLCHWVRQAIGLICGVVWGMGNVRGWTGFLVYFLVNISFAPTLLAKRLRGVSVTTLGESLSFEMTKDGFMNSFTLMLITWIVTHTLMQPVAVK